MSTSRPPQSDASPRAEHGDRRTRARRGFTLVELVVVLVIVAAVAAIAALSVTQVAAEAPRDVTKVSFTQLREALARYKLDVGAYPPTLDELCVRRTAPQFNVATRRGWRGPYLASSSTRYVVNLADGFTSHYAFVADGTAPMPGDGWARSIVLQYPDIADDGLDAIEREHVRLVSAGDNGKIDTPRIGAAALLPTLAQCDDDLVLYLRVQDVRE